MNDNIIQDLMENFVECKVTFYYDAKHDILAFEDATSVAWAFDTKTKRAWNIVFASPNTSSGYILRNGSIKAVKPQTAIKHFMMER